MDRKNIFSLLGCHHSHQLYKQNRKHDYQSVTFFKPYYMQFLIQQWSQFFCIYFEHSLRVNCTLPISLATAPVVQTDCVLGPLAHAHLQGSQPISRIKFHDFSMIFHDLFAVFPWSTQNNVTNFNINRTPYCLFNVVSIPFLCSNIKV